MAPHTRLDRVGNSLLWAEYPVMSLATFSLDLMIQ
jgi:hypothetical protein